MNTCITVWHWPEHERWYDEGLSESLIEIKRAGISHINWNPDSGSSYIYSNSEMHFIKDKISEYGLITHSIHASNGRNRITEFKDPKIYMEDRKNILSVHKWQREAGVELIQNRLDLAHILGSPNVVLHIDVLDKHRLNTQEHELFYTNLFESLDILKPYALNLGVKIAVENLFIASEETYRQLFNLLFSKYEEDYLGLCYDTGHWELISPGTVNILDLFGDRLIATHIHDNFGKKDDHLLPFDGRLNWEIITKKIANTNYLTPLNFETPKDRYSSSDFTFYNAAYSVANRLETMIHTFRNKDN